MSMTCCFPEKCSPVSLLKQNVEPLNEDSCVRAWQIILIVSLNGSLKSETRAVRERFTLQKNLKRR